MVQEIVDILKNIELYCVTNFYNSLVNKRYKLQKDKNIEYKLLDAPKFTQTVVKENNRVFKETYTQIIENFVSTMKEKLPEPALNAMYHNLKTLKIGKTNNSIISMFLCGLYIQIPNVIILTKNNRGDATVTHELLHMSSLIIGKNNMASGFYMNKVGRSLNEGYTEVLNNRLFGHPITQVPSYNMYAKFASVIEDIIGKNNMTNLYFTADLKGLFEQLSYYSSREKTSVFLKDLDSLYSSKFLIIINSSCFDRIIDYLTYTSIDYVDVSIKTGTLSLADAGLFLQKYREKIESINDDLNKLAGRNVKSFQSEIFDNFCYNINEQLNDKMMK